MEQTDLQISKDVKIKKNILLSILEDVCNADGDYFDMKATAGKYGLSRSERYEVESFLENYLAIKKSEVYKADKLFAEGLYELIENDKLEQRFEDDVPKELLPISVTSLQINSGIGYSVALNVYNKLAESGLLVYIPGKGAYFNTAAKKDSEV